MPKPETLTQTLRRCAREVRAALARADRLSLRFAEDIDGLHVTIGAKQSAETVDDSPDLPDVLRVARPATRQVYWAIRALRAELGPTEPVWPWEIRAHLDARYPVDAPHSIDTINHALRALREHELAWSLHPRGWQLGREQPRLPATAGQSDRPSQPELRSYSTRMANAGVRRFSSGSGTMPKQRIWVPGEKDEYQRGVVVVTDAATEALVGVAERTGTMQVPKRLGGLRESAAVQAELLRVEGKIAVVKLPGVAAEFRTRILGDWQLEGRREPEPEAVAVETSGAA